ncbi:MAG: L,D-transpeptidase [Gammaproteobacteria bacterium]|nr:L,D-transpeptidase [Gammaproteobacteria bacterium]
MRFIMVLLSLLAVAVCPVVQAEPWLLVDSEKGTLAVMEDDQTVRVFRHIAVGRGGVAAVRRAGDGTTPRGEFRIAWVNPDSSYHLFFGLDYPGMTQAEEALRSRLIDPATYERIRRARDHGELPPQDTLLGGYIGIHGVGSMNAGINPRYNWTQGCIALSDEEIDHLARWAGIGTRVVIR